MRTTPLAAVGALTLAASALTCHSSTPGSATKGDIAPTNRATVEVALNGRSVAPIPALCSRGLFLSTRVKNVSTSMLQLQRLALRFESSDGRCQTHTPVIDPTIERSLAPGRDEEVKVFDAAGSLCDPPTGGPSCSWHTSATVFTDAGFAGGALDFSNSSGDARGACRQVPPVVYTPVSGMIVSGTVGVTASVPEDGGCVISARTRVWVYSDRGIIVASSGDLDLGLVWSWDTSRNPNGIYRLRASQNCCNVLGEPVEVTVRN
jgi:hypothetical protein